VVDVLCWECGFGPHGVLILVIRVCKHLEVYDSFYTHFAFKTALCNSLEGTRLMVWPISNFVTVTCIVIFCVWVYSRRGH
jgi:hypothetical protein